MKVIKVKRPKSTKVLSNPMTPNLAICQIALIFLLIKLATIIPKGVAAVKKIKIKIA